MFCVLCCAALVVISPTDYTDLHRFCVAAYALPQIEGRFTRMLVPSERCLWRRLVASRRPDGVKKARRSKRTAAKKSRTPSSRWRHVHRDSNF